LKKFYADAKITGSKNHELLQKFNEMNQKFTTENLTLIEKRLNNEFNFNQKTADSINEAYEKLLIKKYRFTANFSDTHGEYEVAPYIALSEIADINISYLEEVAKKLSPKVANSKYGKMLTKHIEERKKNK
jgi:tetrahydrodipicolinate N-succinyltransferase